MSRDPRKYKGIGYDQLITFCVFSLQQKGREVTFEELVKEAFDNFPERFRLYVKDRMWPDAALINKSWLRARTDKKWIVGNRASGFGVTPAGKKIAEQVAKQIETVSRDSSKMWKDIGDQTRSTRIIKQVLGSVAFKKYNDGRTPDISEYEFCDSIFCTLDSPPEVKSKNMALVMQHAHEIDQRKVVDYLNEVRSKFSHLLLSETASRMYKGGMMRKKI